MQKTLLMAFAKTTLLCTVLVSCAYSQSSQTADSKSPNTYTDAIQPIFDAKCTSCHGGNDPDEGLSLQSWATLMRGGDDGESVIAFDAKRSLLVEMATKLVGGPHPRESGGDTLSGDEVAALRKWIDDGARNDAGEVPFADARNLLYVCNQTEATVSVIDMDTKVVVRVVDLQEPGFSPNSRPHHIAVEPDGSHWYLSLIGDDAILKFDRSNELVARVNFERPGLLVVDPDEDVLVVGRSMKAVNPPQRIGVVNRTTMEIEELDVFIARPHALALSNDGRFLYSASLAANQVVTMNRETEEIDLYNVPGPIHTLVQFAVSPDGSTLAIGGQMTGKFLFFDLSNPESPEVVDSLQVPSGPWHPIYSPDGKYIYLGNKGASVVTVIDIEGPAIAAEISGRGIAQPHGSALSRDGRFLFISNNNTNGSYSPRNNFGDNATVGTVTVINTESRRIVRVIEVGLNATGLGTAAPS